MSTYSEELKVACNAAREAADIIREYHRGQSFDIDFKGKNDLVTDADLSAEKKILSLISEAFPDDRILAEESGGEKKMLKERTWLIDPIDGTTNFAHKFPVFCVSIALWQDHTPRVGVVLEVNRDELFTAVRGEGARLNDQPIEVSGLQDPANAMIGTGFPYNDLSLIDHYVDFFKWLMHNTQGVRRPGAASYDLCCVAAGRFDGFYEYSLNPWDVGAAAFIAREAGAVVTDWTGGDNWLFGERIVAGNPHIHDFLLNGINDRFLDEELTL